MLVLSRKRDEDIVVNGPCILRVVAVNGDRARIGVIADLSTSVMRGEVIERDERHGLRDLWQRLKSIVSNRKAA